MLVISREAIVKAGKHAWNVYPLEAFGYLLGKMAEKTIYAALPCSKTLWWYEYADRWNGIAENLEKAQEVARLFSLEVIGFYASTEGWQDGEYPGPDFSNDSSQVFMIYHAIHCPACSQCSFKHNGQWLKYRNEHFAVCHGKRLTHDINQKRILKEWRRVYGAVDYSNRYRENLPPEDRFDTVVDR